MESGEPMGTARTRGILLVVVLSVLQSLFRLVFFYMSVTGAELLEVEMTVSAMQLVNMMFLLIGVAGMITAFGLYQMKRWGYWGTILLSVVTIIFDIWGLTIQFTAAMGLVLPVTFIAYLYPNRELFR
jgi:uncharacterized membrane protein (DUF2068 family)